MNMDRVNFAIAGTAVASPAWLPYLEGVSQIAALLLPVVGVVWISMQVWAKIKSLKKG